MITEHHIFCSPAEVDQTAERSLARARRISKSWRMLSAAVAVGCLLVGAGCSRTPEKLYRVSGTVRVGDKLMDSGTIQFEMLERGVSGKVYTSTSTIDREGRYQLQTFERPGAPAGRHRVWVVPDFASMPDQLGVRVDRLSPVPRKYMLPTTTDLEYEVVAGSNVIDVQIPEK